MGSSLLPPYRKPLVSGSCLIQTFSPLDLAPAFYMNMAFNTDANNAVLVTAADLSGNGRNFTANTANMLVKTGVQNGLRIVRFPGGSGDSFTRATNGPVLVTTTAWFMIAVGKNNALAAPAGFPLGNPCIYSNANASVGFGYCNNTPLIGDVVDDGSAEQTSEVATDTTGFHLWMGRVDSGNIIFNQDGGAEDSTGCNTAAALNNASSIGQNYTGAANWTGDLGALLICNYVPTLAQRTAAFNYFKTQWGTP